MKCYPAILVVLLVLLPLTVQAEILEYSLPGLAGPSGDPPKTASFVYVGPPVDVNDVDVRFAGTIYDLGLIACSVAPGVDPYSSWLMDCVGWIYKKDAPGEGKWFGGDIIFHLGDFAMTRDSDDGFVMLEEGDVVEMELDFSMNDDWQWPSPMGFCSLIRETYGELASITVILDVTIQVPVKQTTWGSIKSLY